MYTSHIMLCLKVVQRKLAMTPINLLIANPQVLKNLINKIVVVLSLPLPKQKKIVIFPPRLIVHEKYWCAYKRSHAGKLDCIADRILLQLRSLYGIGTLNCLQIVCQPNWKKHHNPMAHTLTQIKTHTNVRTLVVNNYKKKPAAILNILLTLGHLTYHPS